MSMRKLDGKIAQLGKLLYSNSHAINGGRNHRNRNVLGLEIVK